MRIPSDHRLSRGDQPSPLGYAARVARRSSDGALALYAAAGLLGVALLLIQAPHWWVLVPTFVALALFGLWGIVDRSAAERAARAPASDLLSQALSLLRVILAIAGIVAALLAVLLPLSASVDNVIH